MSSTPRLERVLGEISRAAEYIDPDELQVQTGHEVSRFADVALKELADNAIDACEDANVTPAITATVEWRSDGSGLLRVQDNGAGIPATTVARTLDFGTRTSDKSPYRSPTRGMQGNALKTIYGLPTALCGADAEPVRITACGVRHTIAL